MALVLPTTLVQGTTANAPDVMSDLNAIVNYINNTLAANQIPSGSETVWLQATAPSGWTQDTSKNDMVLRLVNDGSGGGTGGSWTISGLSVATTTTVTTTVTPSGTVTINNHVLLVSEIPAHTHNVTVGGDQNFNTTSGAAAAVTPLGSSNNYTTDNGTGGGGGHNHTGSLSLSSPASSPAVSVSTPTSDGTWRPAYVNMLAATKN